MEDRKSTVDSDRSIELDEKHYLHELYEVQVADFKRSSTLEPLRICPISLVPQRTFSTDVETYNKEKIRVKQGMINVIKKNDKPVSFTWISTPEKIKAAVRQGIYCPEALTAKVLYTIGSYRARVLERVYEDGIVSTRYQAKEALLTLWQDRVELLQSLERLINTESDVVTVKQAFEDYINAVQAYKGLLEEKVRPLVKYDAAIQDNWAWMLDEDIAAIEKLRDSVTDQSLPSLLAAYGGRSLLTTLNVRMIAMTKEVQGLNQNLTHARPERDYSFWTALWRGDFSWFRGYFNDVCEDVLRVIHEYEPDLHNPVLAAHQGDFTQDSKAEADAKQQPAPVAKRCLDFAAGDKKALAAICMLEGADVLDDKMKLTTSGESIQLKTTGFINWSWNSAYRKRPSLLKRLVYFILNVVTGIIATCLDFPWGLIVGLGGLDYGSLVEKLRKPPQDTLADTTYKRILDTMKVSDRHVVFGSMHLLGQTIRQVVVDVLHGIVYIAKEFKRFPTLLQNDLYVGGRKDQNLSFVAVMAQFKNDIEAIKRVQHGLSQGYAVRLADIKMKLKEAEKQDALQSKSSLKLQRQKSKEEKRQDQHGLSHGDAARLADSKIHPEEESEATRPESPPAFSPLPKKDGYSLPDLEEFDDTPAEYALPPYHLTPGEWDDVLSRLPSGMCSFGMAILHPVHMKNPFLGLIYNVLYFGGGFSVAAPQQVPLPEAYKQFSQWLGAQMAHNLNGQAISSAVTQGGLGTTVLEGFMNGRKSVLGRSFSTVEEGVADVAIVIGMAVLWGTILKSAPYIGPVINDEVGETAVIGATTWGVKAAVLVYELFETAEEGKLDEAYKNKFEDNWLTYLNTLSPDLAKALPSHGEVLETITDPKIKAAIFLYRLAAEPHLLPHLPSRTKCELLQQAEKLFPEQPAAVKAVEHMLNPPQPCSIFGRMCRIVLGYLGNAVRLICAPFYTWNFKKPFIDLVSPIKKDLTRVWRGLVGLGRFVSIAAYAAFYSPLRALADVITNSFFARLEGWSRGNKHDIADTFTQVSASMSSTYYCLAGFFTPSSVYKAVTQPDRLVVVQEPGSKRYFGKLFRSDEMSRSTSESDSPSSQSIALSSSRNSSSVAT